MKIKNWKIKNWHGNGILKIKKIAKYRISSDEFKIILKVTSNTNENIEFYNRNEIYENIFLSGEMIAKNLHSPNEITDITTYRKYVRNKSNNQLIECIIYEITYIGTRKHKRKDQKS